MMKQRGAAALLVVSVLLVAALMMSLGSYKSLFYQIKRANNQIEARQEHWRAEGGLECVYSLVHSTGSISAASSLITSQCKTPLNLHQLTLSPNHKLLSKPDAGTERTIEKQIVLSRGRASGALKSSTDLYVFGSSAFSTPDPGELSRGGWECVAIRYKNAFNSHAGATNQGVIHGSAPYADFVHDNIDCKSDHKTVTGVNSGFGEDFVRDTDLEPFYDIFREPRSDWSSVKSGWGFTAIDFDDVTNQVVTDCGKKVGEKIAAGDTHIWVTGSCEFTSSKRNASGGYDNDADGNPIIGGIDYINDAFTATGGVPILLLVQDGIFAVHGSMTFPGMLYQLTTSSLTGLETHWDLFEAKDYFGDAGVFPTFELNKVVYLQRGSFRFSGGQVLDSPGYSAYFAESLNFAYNRDNLDEIIDPIIKPSWKKGSWNDL